MNDLLDFLSVPLSDGSAIFDKFAALPGAVYHRGQSKLQRFVYVPGTRKDRVVLIAHTDTVWDDAYLHKTQSTNLYINPKKQITSSEQNVGIGADDRAGCAILWKLRNSGHSLLLLDGEEKGHHGALFLKKQYPTIFRALNKHHYMVQLDLWGNDFCMYHNIPNCKEFSKYMESGLSLKPLDKNAGTDVSYLCRQACGINISTGFNRNHTQQEWIDGNAWTQICANLAEFLAKPQPKFKTNFFKRAKKDIMWFIKGVFRKGYSLLKRVFPLNFGNAKKA